MKVCRLVVGGNQDSGAKALVWSFLQGKIEDYDPFNDYEVQIEVDGVQCILDILDGTIGQEEYSALLDAWIRDGQGFVLLYSITSQSTFNDLTQFHQRILHIKDTEKVPMVLVGNNCELEDDRIVTKEQGSSLALQWGIPFFETSTRNSINIDQVFFELVRQIIRSDQKKYQATNASNIPFLIACGIGNLEDVKSMLKDEKVNVNETNNIGATPFYVACQKGHIEIVKLLFNHERVDVNKTDIFDQMPFYTACEKGHLEIVKLLLNNKQVKINKADNIGWTPLMIACSHGYIEIVKYILASEREVNLSSKNKSETAIDIAKQSGKENIVELLKSFQKNPNLTRIKLRNQLLVEEFKTFQESIETEKNEQNLSAFKNIISFLGMEPTYFFPLISTSQNEITHLSLRNSTLDPIPIALKIIQNLIHLDLSNNEIQEVPSLFSKLTRLQYLDISRNKINDQGAQIISKLIQKSKEILVINLGSNKIQEKGANIIEKSLKFNSSLTDLFLDGNNISEAIIKGINEVLEQKRNTLDFNTVSVYLLGYGHVGKTTLRQTIKNMGNITSKLGLNQKSQTVKNNLQTECVEIDRRVNIGKTNIQIIDFGGQKEYHHGTHLFTRISRSIFLILSNPFDFGFEEQVWYWLRLLNIKSLKNQNQKAEVMILFSHKDKEDDRNKIQVIETKLENLVNELRIEFEETITINTLWMWMNCTKTKTNEMKQLLNELEKTVNKVMDEFRMNIPDISIPQKIVSNLNQIFYERNELEIEIGKILKSDEFIGSHWINILLESHDFLSININHGNEKGKEYICVDLEKFGKDTLSQIIKPNASKYIYSSSDIIEKIPSNENGKWKLIFCEILESLELCFQKGGDEYLFPSMLPINSTHNAEQFWKEDNEGNKGRKYCGRRLQIEDKKLMFHPSFLPQLICHLLLGIVVDEEPFIWNEGLILRHSREYFIGLFMHGVMESNLQENESNESIQTISNSRKHGEPNRLKMMDILIKGPNIIECQKLVDLCLESIKYINAHFYGNLKWNQEILFPLTVEKYFSIADKRNIFSIPLNENKNNGEKQIHDMIKGEITEEKLLALYNSGDKNESINKHLIRIAFHEGYFEVIKKIIGNENQAKINNEIMFGIYLSCQNGHSNILEYVIGSGIQIDFRKTFWNKNCLEIASEEQNNDIVKIICQFQLDPLKIKTEYRKKYGFPSEEEIGIVVVIGEKNEKMKITPPFSLYELSLSMKSTFTILDDIHMQIYDSKFNLFFDLKNINEVKMDSILKVITSSFWTLQVDDRWDKQGEGIKLEKLCISKENRIIDESLYNKFYEILTKLGFNQETQKLKQVFAINNMELKKGFEAHRNILFSKELASPKDFKSHSWRNKSNSELRSFFLDHLNDYINQFNWNDGNKPVVIPMVHGTCEKYIWQICQHGLTTLAKLDSGYYGQGVYFTRNLSYARSYAKMAASSNKSTEYFVICCVIPGNVYPVTEHPESSNSLKGKPRIPGYQSHFTIVDKQNVAKIFPITKKDFVPEFHADELVVFQDAQILPIFAFSLN